MQSPVDRSDMTGLSTPSEQGLGDVSVPQRRPLSMAWVSDERIAETQRLWSKRYGRDLAEDEAVEILQNILQGKTRRTKAKVNLPLAAGLFTCEHCGAMITGERIKRKLKGGGVRVHDYYRCANNYPDDDHPSVRWRADDLEDAIIADLTTLKMPDDEVAEWFRESLQTAFADIGELQRNQRMALAKRRSELTTMNDRLLNAFLAGSIDEAAFNAKLATLRDELAQLEASLDNAPSLEPADVRAALTVFEFSQKIPEIWRGSKMLQERRSLETLSLNRIVGDVSLVLEQRKPFDALAKRPEIQLSRDDWPDFEPSEGIVTPFMLPFLNSPEHHFLVADRIYREAA